MSSQVSVIIPHRNRAADAIRAVQSVLDQELAADEVIVVDDGSSEATEPLEQFCAQQSVEFVRSAHHGVSHARNLGVSRSNGGLLAFLDSDDLWHPRKLSAQVAAHRESASRLSHTPEIWVRNGKRVNQRFTHDLASGDAFAVSLRRCAISASSVLIDRELFLEHSGFREELPAAEDYDLWLRLSLDHSVCLVSEALVTKHGGHADQLSRTVPALDRFRVESILRLLTRHPLAEPRRSAARASLLEKLRVLALGAQKRDPASAAPIESVAQRIEALSADFRPAEVTGIYESFRTIIAPYLLAAPPRLAAPAMTTSR